MPRHQYSPGIVRLFLEGILQARAGQRSLAAVLKLVSPFLPTAEGNTPCPNTGRMWLLRTGLFELTRPKPKAGDWVLIMDHTVQLGPLKALIIVGVRLSEWEPVRGPLQHHDVALMDLMPMRQSNAAAVATRLEVVAAQSGVPRAIVCDGGGDLRGGIALFRKAHVGVAAPYDIKHKTALLLQHELEQDARWTQFVSRVNQARSRLVLTDLACLTPPAMKLKARYMNLPPLVQWGLDSLAFVDAPRDFPGQPVDRKVLRKKLGWLAEYRKALSQWSVLLRITETAEDYVRREGYHASAAAEVARGLKGLANHTAARTMERALLEFVNTQSAAARPRERLIGSSEVLESLIGKYKQLQGSYKHGGITPQLLALGAMVVPQSAETIVPALRTIRTCDVRAWCRRHLGFSLQSQRQYAFEESQSCVP